MSHSNLIFESISDPAENTGASNDKSKKTTFLHRNRSSHQNNQNLILILAICTDDSSGFDDSPSADNPTPHVIPPIYWKLRFLLNIFALKNSKRPRANGAKREKLKNRSSFK